MEYYCDRSPWNPFERQVVDHLARSDFDGIMTNNLTIANLETKWIPDEIDILVLAQGHIYTIDAKELWPGLYRGSADGVWECSENGREFWPMTGDFSIGHPHTIALQKQKKMLAMTKSLMNDPRPIVISVIVVPDHANISGIEWREESLGGRLLLTPLSELSERLKRDHAMFRQRRPTAQAMAEALRIREPMPVEVRCRIGEHLEILELDSAVLGRRLPVPRRSFRARYELLGKEVRVEFLPRFSTASASRHRKAVRSLLQAALEFSHSDKPALVAHFPRSSDVIIVTEWFSDQTLEARLEAGPLTWSAARPILAPIVNVLRAAHAAGISHRFLDPTCVLLSRSDAPTVKVHGFYGALVGEYSAVTLKPGLVDPYAAPEAGDANRAESHLLDAFAVGRIARAMLTGDPHGEPTESAAPLEVIDVIDGLTQSDRRLRARAWEELPRALAAP